ncbi:MAG: hypothetical protein NC548_49340 [Lachnospiraceae bacterium]|nr:hypothetical protein [Lachnospiraceae bacterium]
MKNNFDLIMCCLGNGITIYNKSVAENGSYKIIGSISTGGNIRLYVENADIPADGMAKIIAIAKEQEEEYRKYFECLPPHIQYNKILNAVPRNKYVEYIRRFNIKFTDILPEMREYYYTII